MIRIGHVTKDGTDVVYETVSGAVNATASVNALKLSLAGDSSVKYFYLESQITDTEWNRYGFVDPD
tara:strand:- start:68 stop:265 length:198 start_codon:yes stop_codon:yes gene_type:complete